ncbi:hypothetical protein HPB48_003755 [Haemaphysalis longicornis]|uniref:Uncharacterized protein n=1 Tax=Haemaphysalis longicornis TaxID=44386 RepID=A0A9J6FIX9_HAELO|nr:hypothetical protein HPB48_003755 [Haemaphysalis longicornis]
MRAPCTPKGVFQFRTQRGQEVIRELKRAVSLWAARKAALASWCQSRAVAQRSSCVRLGRSAPATPSLSMPPAWRRQPESPEAARSCSGADGRDMNYVLPAFERSSSSLSNGSVLSSPQLGRPCQSDPERLGSRADTSCEDANYVRVTAAVHGKGRVSFRRPGSPTPLVQLVAASSTLQHDKKLQEIRRAEGEYSPLARNVRAHGACQPAPIARINSRDSIACVGAEENSSVVAIDLISL